MDRVNTAFEFSHVFAGYHNSMILNDISFAVSRGEMVGVLGANGAGKSTLIRVLTGLHPPVSGRIVIFGNDVGKIRAEERSRIIAVVPQELKTPMAYTVEELVRMGRTAVLSPWEKLSSGDHRIIERAMIYTDISHLRDRSLDALSGGEKQRAVVAMALAQKPQIILMDEPTTHLDVSHSLEIMQIIERLNIEENITVLLTSHDLNLASEFCRRLILLDCGRVVADGPPAEVLREDILGKVYHCNMRIQRDTNTGSVIVMPERRLQCSNSGNNLRVHVIAGGGSGCEIIRNLSLRGYRLTCGVLNQRDTDADVTGALGIETVLEKPFSPIGTEAYQQAEMMVKNVAAVVLCEVPFGSGNIANINIAEKALENGLSVLVNDRDIKTRDYSPGKEAVAKIDGLIRAGAVVWRDINEVPALLARAITSRSRPGTDPQ